MVKTAISQNGDKPKRLQVQSKCINLLSSTMNLFSELLTKFQFAGTDFRFRSVYTHGWPCSFLPAAAIHTASRVNRFFGV